LSKNHKPTGRLYWESYVELDSYQKNEKILAVNVGADDPTLLEMPEALKFASKVAKRLKFNTLVEIEDDIRLYGQNNLAERTFLFKK
jgi:hypothetical protein